MEKNIRYILIGLTIILTALVIVLFLQYRALQQQTAGDLRARSALFLENHAPLPVADAGTVRSWMTFDYINKLFGLPPAYLKSRLDISASSSYPRMTLSGYAKNQQLDLATFVTNVQDAVRGFSTSTVMLPGPPTSTKK